MSKDSTSAFIYYVILLAVKFGNVTKQYKYLINDNVSTDQSYK